MFRQHEGQNAYIFDISIAAARRFWKMTAQSLFPDQPNRTYFVLRTPDQHIHSGGSANTVFVRAIGGHFTLYATRVCSQKGGILQALDTHNQRR